MTTTCDLCACPAAIETAWGDSACAWHYDHAPTTEQCPNCQALAEDSPAPPGVESDSDAPDAGFPTASGATIARVGVPPATPARVPLSHLLGAVDACAIWAHHEGDDADASVAWDAIDIVRDAITALAGYRSLGHVAADEPGWYVVTSWVPKDVVDQATSVLQRVKP